MRIVNGFTLRETIKRRKAEARDKKETVRCFGTKLLLGKRLRLGYVLFTDGVGQYVQKGNCAELWRSMAAARWFLHGPSSGAATRLAARCREGLYSGLKG